MNKLLTGKYEVQLLISKDEGKLPPLPPKLNQIDDSSDFHNDAFSPLSAGGLTLELKGSEFDDGGPSAHSSVLLSSPPLGLKSEKSISKSKGSIFNFRKESSLNSEPKSLAQLHTETSKSKGRASAANKSSATDSISRSTKDLFEDLKEDEVCNTEITRSPTSASRPTAPSPSSKPNPSSRAPSRTPSQMSAE